jgi:hypothetical protein
MSTTCTDRFDDRQDEDHDKKLQICNLQDFGTFSRALELRQAPNRLEEWTCQCGLTGQEIFDGFDRLLTLLPRERFPEPWRQSLVIA